MLKYLEKDIKYIKVYKYFSHLNKNIYLDIYIKITKHYAWKFFTYNRKIVRYIKMNNNNKNSLAKLSILILTLNCYVLDWKNCTFFFFIFFSIYKPFFSSIYFLHILTNLRNQYFWSKIPIFQDESSEILLSIWI